MSECDYLAWLTYESFRRIIYLEGTKTVGSEVFQAPICATQSICNLLPLRQPLKFGSITLDGQNLQS